MTSKVIFSLLLIAYVAIQIYAECPHSWFLDKHVCTNCNSDESFKRFVKDAALDHRSQNQIVTTATVYKIRNRNDKKLWEEFMRNGEPHCKTKAKYDKLDCKKIIFECSIDPEDDGAHDMKSRQCPDPNFVANQVCWTCTDPTYAGIFARNAAERGVFEGKERVKIYALDNKAQSGPTHWEVKNNKCRFKTQRKTYRCIRKEWVCEVKNMKEGHAIHNLKKNGHLADWN